MAITDIILGGGLGAALGAFAAIAVIIGLAVYIYMAVALMAIAKKTNTPNGWFGFIPILNIYLLTQIGGVSGWWTAGILLSIIPIVGGLAVAALMCYLLWQVAEKCKKPGWWGILIALIPIVNLVMIGILAWGKK